MADIKKCARRGCKQPVAGKNSQYCTYSCALVVVALVGVQLQRRRGKYFERWKRGVLNGKKRK